jgi:murein DD-endopeptidase MepM/ murein hydrolase activator NlpD
VKLGTLITNAVAVPAGLLLVLLPLVCGPVPSGVLPSPYVPRSAHQAYGYGLAQTRLAKNASAREWFTAAERALREPIRATAPFEAVPSFAADVPDARSYAFAVRDGRQLQIDTLVETNEPPEVFVELFQITADGLELVVSSLPASRAGAALTSPLQIEVLEPADYLLRVQPALVRAPQEGAAADYALRIKVRTPPLLAFPVQGFSTRAIQSVFGAERDGGRRAHRGVDIFAPRGTTAVAAVDAWVTRVETTRIGGNVVWLQPLFGNMRLYYAHLEEQFVERGQFVLAGEPIGAVGNTGNAITTPPHLHFGVYVRQPGVRGGARDPYGFLQ